MDSAANSAGMVLSDKVPVSTQMVEFTHCAIRHLDGDCHFAQRICGFHELKDRIKKKRPSSEEWGVSILIVGVLFHHLHFCCNNTCSSSQIHKVEPWNQLRGRHFDTMGS